MTSTKQKETTYLVTSQLVAILVKQIRDLLYIDGIIEGCGITNLSLVGWNFALKTLD